MDWITTSGGSIDEAKSNALDQLGIVADEAEFDVINDIEKGLFGRVKTEAKVRARVRPKQPAVKDDRRRRAESGGGRKRGGDGSGGRSKGGNGGSSDGRSRGGGGRGRQSSDRPSGSQKQQRSRAERGDSKQSRKDQPERGQSEGRRQSSGSGRNGGGRGQAASGRKPAGDDDAGTNGTDKSRDARQQQKPVKEAVDHEFSRQEQEQVAVDFLEGILDVFDMDATVSVVQEPAEDDAIEVAVDGSELGLLVGQKGMTLNALQELTRTVVQREADGARTERLRVDVAGYRERRRAALAEFASKIAKDVIETGSEKVLEPMGPADRKVVHDTVNDMDGVETGSEGEEPRRRVVIRPA